MRALRFVNLNIADCRREIARLSQEEKGAYLDLILTCAEGGGTLENDENLVEIIARLPRSRFRAFFAKFMDIFQHNAEDDCWHHPAIDFQVERLEKAALQRSEAGKKGMEKRWGKHNERYNEDVTPDITPDITPVTQKHNERYNGRYNEKARPNRESENLLSPPTSTKPLPPRPRARKRHIPGKIEGPALADIEAKGTPLPLKPQRSFTPVATTPRQAKMSNAKANLDCKAARYIGYIAGPKAVAEYWERRNSNDPIAAQQTLDTTVAQMNASNWEDRG